MHSTANPIEKLLRNFAKWDFASDNIAVSRVIFSFCESINRIPISVWCCFHEMGNKKLLSCLSPAFLSHSHSAGSLEICKLENTFYSESTSFVSQRYSSRKVGWRIAESECKWKVMSCHQSWVASKASNALSNISSVKV